MGRWQAKLEKKQAFLGRIVDIGAELYAIASAATYANTIKTERPDLAEQAFELADLFCKQARARVDRLFDELWSNNDDANYAAAQAVLDGRFTWVEEGIADPSGDGPMIAAQPDSVDDRVTAPDLSSARVRTLPSVPAPPTPAPEGRGDPLDGAAPPLGDRLPLAAGGLERALGRRARAGPAAAREVARAAEPALQGRRRASSGASPGAPRAPRRATRRLERKKGA